MRTIDLIIWVLFGAACIFLGFFFTKRMKRDAAAKKAAREEYQRKKLAYTYLKPGIFDTMPRSDINAAVLFHCMRKEDEDYDNYYEKMTYGERVVYGIYQLSNSIQGKNPTIQSFFISPATKCYVDTIDQSFEAVGAHDIAELIVAARRFAEIIEKDLPDDEEDMGDYSRYNFSDFTNEYGALSNSTNLNDKVATFVLEHKEDFYDEYIPEDYLQYIKDLEEIENMEV